MLLIAHSPSSPFSFSSTSSPSSSLSQSFSLFMVNEKHKSVRKYQPISVFTNFIILGTKVAAIQAPNYKVAKHEYVGKTVRITSGENNRNQTQPIRIKVNWINWVEVIIWGGFCKNNTHWQEMYSSHISTLIRFLFACITYFTILNHDDLECATY